MRLNSSAIVSLAGDEAADAGAGADRAEAGGVAEVEPAGVETTGAGLCTLAVDGAGDATGVTEADEAAEPTFFSKSTCLPSLVVIFTLFPYGDILPVPGTGAITGAVGGTDPG